MDQASENFKKIIEKLPQLTWVLSKINSADIKYGLHSGAHTAILTSEHIPADVDFLVADEDFVKLKEIFPFAPTKDKGNGIFLYVGDFNEIEFMSNAVIDVGNSHYNFRLSDLCWKNSKLIEDNLFKVRTLNEVDTILLKAMLQRGKDAGKHDLEDIEAILKIHNIDMEYLKERLIEVNPDERLFEVLKRFKLV